LQFLPGQNAETLGLTGHETYTVTGLDPLDTGQVPTTLDVTADDLTFQVRPRLDTTRELDYYRHGGIMQFVLRQMLPPTPRIEA
jgi:aconitate hydratase